MREPLDGLVGGGDDVSLVSPLLGLVHLQQRVAKLVVQLLDRGGIHRATISHAYAPTAMGVEKGGEKEVKVRSGVVWCELVISSL